MVHSTLRQMGGVGMQLEQKKESKKGGATLIRPSSINFTAVFLSSLSKGMEIRFYSLKIRTKGLEIRFYSLKIRKMEKNTKKTTLLCPSSSNKPTHFLF